MVQQYYKKYLTLNEYKNIKKKMGHQPYIQLIIEFIKLSNSIQYQKK